MVTIATESQASGLKPESLIRIDISTLSQSELHALSLCSDAAFDLHRTHDVVVPQIDKTLFNESAGSRRQTYSRLRLDSTSAGHRRRLAGLIPNPKPPPAPTNHDPERAENKSIVNYLKHLISGNDIENLPPETEAVQETPTTAYAQAELGIQELQIALHSSERKRKRGRKPKLKVVENGDGGGVELEILNRNGAAVDLAALANGDDLYGAELRRRTFGLETEEEVLGFLRDLEGQWGSRRRKRRIVDASEFGDALPVGWKLLLGLRRREGRVSVYCRRYISPTGQQFVSCKDVSSYLHSYFGLDDANEPMEQSGNIQQAYGVASESHVGLNHKDDNRKQEILPNSILPSSLISDAHEKEVVLMEIDNLAEVQVRDLFECYKCNMTFDEKNTYLQHLLSFHQRTTRRYRLGTSVGEGVIIKDGKYECQFCHKVFQERRRYNGHVGIHVRNHVRSSEESPGEIAVAKHIESSCQDELPQRISKMDALIEIAQSSILESGSGPNDKLDDDSSHKLNMVTRPEILAAHSDHELSLASQPCDKELEDHMTNRASSQEKNQHGNKSNMTSFCTTTSEHPKPSEVEKHGNSELEIGFANRHIKPNDVETESVGHPVEEFVVQNMVAVSSMPKPNEVDKCGNSELEIGFSNRHIEPNHDVVTESVGHPVEEFVVQNMVADSSMPLTEPDKHIKPNHDVVTESAGHPVEEFVVQNMVADSTMPESVGHRDVVTESVGHPVEEFVIQNMVANSSIPLIEPSRHIKPNHDVVTESVGHPVEEFVIQNMVADSSMPLIEPSRHIKPNHDVVTESVGHPVEEFVIQNMVADSSMPLIEPSRHIKPNHDVVTESVGHPVEEFVIQNMVADSTTSESVGHPVEEFVIRNMVADSSMPLAEPLQLPAFTAIRNEGADELCMVDQKHHNATGFEELRFDELEPLKFSFVNGQESLSPPEVSMELANDAGMEVGFSSSVQFESEAIMLSMTSRHQLTTICVWCRVEFNIEAFDSESQSDSVGFMCPTCRAKISGQLNVLDGGLSANSHFF
ncbi:uncharacterized protein LOC132294271 [Cornus florida]|uniref:uncharacterized protein LOC132294271 n=1 Tax=Cornus florida TaxID=4283 RepID=UPI0028983BFA|nr:uncharacterized protein LOC132294271 [Cornus florida]